eukprot:1016457-Pelagomonas_calceolata.AAC.1
MLLEGLHRVLPNGTGSSAWHQSRPGVTFVRSIQADKLALILLRSLLKTETFTFKAVGLGFCPDTVSHRHVTEPWPSARRATARWRSPDRILEAGMVIKMPSIGGSHWEALSLMHAAERQA